MVQRWIPVAERLPEDGDSVNVTWINRNPEPYYSSIKDVPFTATAVYYNEKWYWWSSTCVDYLKEYGKCDWELVDKDIDIVAWMPLPEPYREGELPKQTNADRIRSMTDEELAIHMMCPNEMGLAEIECDKSDSCNCYECLLNWLWAESEV